MSLNKTIPEGQWVVKYDPAEFDYPFVLETLVDIQSHSQSHDNDSQINHVVFHKNKDTNYSYNKGIPQGAAVIPEVTVIKILLANPVRLNDKRWDTIHLTSASLFLGSTLGHSGFDVSTRKIVIPYTKSEPGFNDYHMVGFTLFEDLFLETRELMEGLIENNYKGLLAAGGPMITLNPMESAWHYPHLNLLVRGEAELLLPHLLDALNRKDLQSLLQEKGFLFHVPGTIIISHLETINRPADFSGFRFALPSREGFPGVDGYKRFLENGLELNLSRGCRRGCIFCSRVQGATLRTLPVESFKQLLGDFAGEVKALGVTSPHALSININDDDILQVPDYAEEVFEAVIAANFKLWGIQTSLNSFFHRREGTLKLNRRVLELIDNKVLYMESKPLVWLGTDAFLKERGKKLGKVLPSEEQILELMEEFEVRGIRNY
ncbi:MAG: hypothetical protein GY757_28565, partial [bacterium]|nr:hypothetical protein [bacterium]